MGISESVTEKPSQTVHALTLLSFANNDFHFVPFSEFLADLATFANQQLVVIEPLSQGEANAKFPKDEKDKFDLESCLNKVKRSFNFRPFQGPQCKIWIHAPDQASLKQVSAAIRDIDFARFQSSTILSASDVFVACNYQSFSAALSSRGKPGFKLRLGNGASFNERPLENDCDEIIPGLFVGNERSAGDEKTITELKVQRIVAVGAGLNVAPLENVERLVVNLDDDVFSDLDRDFWEAADYVKESIDKGVAVLIHCRKGISRSPALCVAALMKRGMTFEEALMLVKSKRPQVAINPGFLQQLKMKKFCDCMARTGKMRIRPAPIVVV